MKYIIVFLIVYSLIILYSIARMPKHCMHQQGEDCVQSIFYVMAIACVLIIFYALDMLQGCPAKCHHEMVIVSSIVTLTGFKLTINREITRYGILHTDSANGFVRDTGGSH